MTLASAPSGLGIYVRGDLLGRVAAYCKAEGFAWAAVPPACATSGDCAKLRAANIPFLFYSTPGGNGSTRSSWMPAYYVATIRYFEELCRTHGARGYIADTEGDGRTARSGWDDASPAAIEALGRELAASQQRTGLVVGLTTFYALGKLWRPLGRICGSRVFLSLQLYADRPGEGNAHIIAEVQAAGWKLHLPSVAAYRWVVVDGPNYARARTAAEVTSAYDDMPGVRAVVVWYVQPAPRGALAAALRGIFKFSAVGAVLGVAVAVAAGAVLAGKAGKS